MIQVENSSTDPLNNSDTENTVLFVLLFLATSIVSFRYWENGLVVTPDTITYYSASKSLISGEGLRQGIEESSPFLTHFPPVTPVLVALIQLCFFPGLEAFSLLNCLCLVAFIILFFALTTKISTTSMAFFASSVALLHPVTEQLFRSGLSEPLFLCLSLATLLFVCNSKILVSSVTAGLALMTRYAGAHFFAFYPLLAVMVGQRKWRDLSLPLIAPAIFILLWLGRNLYVTGTMSDRTINSVSPSILTLCKEITHTVTTSLLLLPEHPLAITIGAIVIAFPLLSFSRRPLIPLALCYVTSLAFPVVSRLFIDAEIPLNARILCLPFYLGISIVLAQLLAHYQQGLPKRIFQGGGGLILVFAMISTHPDTSTSPFESATWRDLQENIAISTLLHESTAKYSNGYDFLSLYFNCEIESLPSRYDAGSREELPDSLPSFQEQLPSSALFIFTEKVHWRWYLWSEQALVNTLRLTSEYQDNEIRIYRFTKSNL
ncbi:MAG: hypothetical protein KDD70_09950 [Bdellovibrionales bacterium]|nr:hypothetical protein [Bdellovibrionales bacterium]